MLSVDIHAKLHIDIHIHVHIIYTCLLNTCTCLVNQSKVHVTIMYMYTVCIATCSLVSRLPPQVYGRPLTYGRNNWDEP